MRLLKTQGVCLVNCAISRDSIQAGIAVFERSGVVVVVSPESPDEAYSVEIPDELSSPQYQILLKRLS